MRVMLQMFFNLTEAFALSTLAFLPFTLSHTPHICTNMYTHLPTHKIPNTLHLYSDLL